MTNSRFLNLDPNHPQLIVCCPRNFMRIHNRHILVHSQFLASSIRSDQTASGDDSNSSLTRVNLEHMCSASAILPARSMYLAHLELMYRSAMSSDWASSNQCIASLISPACCHTHLCHNPQSFSIPSTISTHTRQTEQTIKETVRIRAFRFAIRINSTILLGESIVLLKKSATRFGRCIRLINNHMPWHSPVHRRCISHSTHYLTDVTADVFVKLWEWLMMTE